MLRSHDQKVREKNHNKWLLLETRRDHHWQRQSIQIQNPLRRDTVEQLQFNTI